MKTELTIIALCEEVRGKLERSGVDKPHISAITSLGSWALGRCEGEGAAAAGSQLYKECMRRHATCAEKRAPGCE